MRLILKNKLVIIVIALPLLILQKLRHYSSWIEEHHEGLGVILWLLALVLVYFWLLARLGLDTNPEFFRNYL